MGEIKGLGRSDPWAGKARAGPDPAGSGGAF